MTAPRKRFALDGTGLASARQRPALRVQSVCLGFLGSRPFRRKAHAYQGWISLDFLGFSRPNQDFSMGYATFRRKNISRAFSAAGEAPEREPGGLEPCGRAELFMG
jgi:hypothetical protein